MNNIVKIKDNFKFFYDHYLPSLYKLWLPVVVVVDEPTEEFQGCNELVGVFAQRKNGSPVIIIIRKHNCFSVRCHEYGHWFFWRVYLFVDALWELPWWGLSIRELFIKRHK